MSQGILTPTATTASPAGAAFRRLSVLVLLLAAFAAACGESDDPQAPGDPWPMTVGLPGILGYVALPAEPVDIAYAFDSILGWRPEGLGGDGPLGLILLDQTVFGGELAWVLPLEDEDALRRSLAECELLADLGGDRFEFTIPASHPAVQMLRLAGRMSGAGGPAEMLAALRDNADLTWQMQLAVERDRALLAPSFEGSVVARRMLGEVPGLLDPELRGVLSLDAKRIHLAFQEEIEGVVMQFRSLLLGAQMAGVGMMLTALAGEEGRTPDLGLPVPGPFLWAVLEMLAVDEVEGVQLSADGFDGGALLRTVATEIGEGAMIPGGSGGQRRAVDQEPDPDGAASPFPEDEVGGTLRLRWSATAAPAQLLNTLRPALPVRGAVSLGFDPAGFATEFGVWCRPIIELAMGEGAPADRLAQELGSLLQPCSGALLVGVEPGAQALVLPLEVGSDLEVDGLLEVIELLARTAGADGFAEGFEALDGPPAAGQAVAPGQHWQDGDVFVLALAPCEAAGLARLLGLVREDLVDGPPSRGAVLELPLPDGIEAAFHAHRGELSLDLSVRRSELEGDSGPDDGR